MSRLASLPELTREDPGERLTEPGRPRRPRGAPGEPRVAVAPAVGGGPKLPESKPLSGFPGAWGVRTLHEAEGRASFSAACRARRAYLLSTPFLEA